MPIIRETYEVKYFVKGDEIWYTDYVSIAEETLAEYSTKQ